MSRYIRERYKGFQSYTPGEQPKEMEYIKLNTNESPFPPAPGVCRKLKEADIERLRLYPNPTGRRLKGILADRFRVEPENVFNTKGFLRQVEEEVKPVVEEEVKLIEEVKEEEVKKEEAKEEVKPAEADEVKSAEEVTEEDVKEETVNDNSKEEKVETTQSTTEEKEEPNTKTD